jgi:hypothetical protein
VSSTATLIAEAKAALAAADAADQQETDARQISSEARWLAAERMAQLSDRMGRREIAAAVGLSDRTVGYYVACVQKGGHARAHLFTEVLKEVRGGWGHAPTSIDGKAKAVADYVKDPQVFNNPEVLKALTNAQRKHSAAQLPPKPAASLPPPRGLLAATDAARADHWSRLIGQVIACREEIDKAITEIRRSGLPAERGAQLIRELRRLAAATAKAEKLLTDTAIGKAETS